jgi:hypothetical protein
MFQERGWNRGGIGILQYSVMRKRTFNWYGHDGTGIDSEREE